MYPWEAISWRKGWYEFPTLRQNPFPQTITGRDTSDGGGVAGA